MRTLAAAVVGFLVLCGLLWSLANHDRAEPEARPPDRAAVLMSSALDDVTRIEAAMERADYGQARRQLTTARARLTELLNVYNARRAEAEQR